MAGPTAAPPCSESPRQDSPRPRGIQERSLREMTWQCFLPLCSAPVPLCGSSPTATPPPRLQETAPGIGSSFPSALQSRATLTARSSPPQGRPRPQDSHCSDTAGLLRLMSQQVTQHRRPPTLRGRTAPDAGAPLLPSPKARGHSQEDPAPPAGPASRPHLLERGGHPHKTNFRPPPRPPALIGRHPGRCGLQTGRPPSQPIGSRPKSRAPLIGCCACLLGRFAPPLEGMVGCHVRQALAADWWRSPSIDAAGAARAVAGAWQRRCHSGSGPSPSD